MTRPRPDARHHGDVRLTPLPEPLHRGPFDQHDAKQAGVPADRLRARDLDHSVWGVRRVGQATTLAERCELLAHRIQNEAVFSHTTAVRLHGGPLPWRLEQAPTLHVTVPAPHPTPHAKGMAGHSAQLPDSDITFVGGLRVTSVARTWRDMSAVLSLGDLVALGDYFIHWRSPLTTIEDLRWIVERMTGRRGVKKARLALELLDARSESPAESRLRVILMLAGLPRPRVNYETVLTETGKGVRLDLAYPEVKFLIEYQGDYHRERGQWRKDLTRRSRLESQGWYVMELNADDLKDPAELTQRIRTVLARRRREFA